MSKTIFITGASAGFGAACARAFAARGDRLVLAARRDGPLQDLAAELAGQTRVHPLVLDVRDRAAVEAAVAGLPGEFRAVEVLVNNAGLALGLEPSHQVNLDDWDTMVDTNVKGLMYCTRQLLPGMVERNRGHVVNIGSTAGDWPYPGGNVYGGTKAAQIALARSWQAETVRTGPHVHILTPRAMGTHTRARFYPGEDRESLPTPVEEAQRLLATL